MSCLKIAVTLQHFVCKERLVEVCLLHDGVQYCCIYLQ